MSSSGMLHRVLRVAGQIEPAHDGSGGWRRLDAVAGGDGNAFWLMFGAILVFFMQTGFAMLEVGCVSIKNTKNILVKNVFDASLGAICWYVCGYAFAMGGKDDKGIIGATSGDGDGSKAFFIAEIDIYDNAMWLFQWAFAATAATIVSGAVAERVSFGCYLVYSICLTSFIYPAVVHWGWGAGFASAWREEKDSLLGDCGVIDFAGSGVVHLTGGVAALIACVVIGPRTNAFSTGDDKPKQQSVSHQTLGTLILWMGWYGFNGVSTLAITNYGGVAAHTMMTTTLAAAAGCITIAILNYAMDHAIEPAYCNNGILAGLVSITAPCSTCPPWAALIIGSAGAVICYFATKFLAKMRVDDVVGAIPVHGFCGIWGVLAAALFADPDIYAQAYYGEWLLKDGEYTTGNKRGEYCGGIFAGGKGGSMAAAISFLLVVLGWVGGLCLVMFVACKFTIGARVSKEVEDDGMDNSKHGGTVDYYSPVAAISKSEKVSPQGV